MRDRSYAELPAEDRYLGSGVQGEIEIQPGPENRVPVLFENKYVSIIQDRVRFPDGSDGSYMRIFHPAELKGCHGTVMVTRKADQYVLMRIFRHPTRSWELEFPRGFGEPELSPEENARKEVREELGVEVESLEHIGIVCPNTGLLATRAHVFLAELRSLPGEAGKHGKLEAILGYEILDWPTILSKIAEGQVRCGFSLAAAMLVTASSQCSH